MRPANVPAPDGRGALRPGETDISNPADDRNDGSASSDTASDSYAVADAIVAHLTAARQSLACAESLTAGLVVATIADVPGASLVLRGAVVAYAPDLKVGLLGVPAELIDRVGTVHRGVAVALAEGVCARLGATWGLSTTGVAGPGPAEGHPAGTVHVAVCGPSGTATRELRLTGSRGEVRRDTVAAVLGLAATEMGVVVRSTVVAAGVRSTVDPTTQVQDLPAVHGTTQIAPKRTPTEGG